MSKTGREFLCPTAREKEKEIAKEIEKKKNEKERLWHKMSAQTHWAG